MRTNDNKEPNRKMDYIHHYVETNDIENVKYIVTSIPHLTVNAYDEKGRLPLHIALLYEYKEVVQILIDHGADPHCLDYSGSNALHCAAASNNIQYVKLFVSMRVNLFIRNSMNLTPLGIASYYFLEDSDNYKEVVSYLDKAIPRERLLQFCIGLKQIISHHDIYTKNAFRGVVSFI